MSGETKLPSAPDPRQVDCYLDLCLGWKSLRDIVDGAIDLLAEDPTPDWTLALASLRPDELLDARDLIEQRLRAAGVLPDSPMLRAAIKTRALALADGCENLDVPALEDLAWRLYALFMLCPGYMFGDLSIPLVEFPYPPCDVYDGATFRAHLDAHIDAILGLDGDDGT